MFSLLAVTNLIDGDVNTQWTDFSATDPSDQSCVPVIINLKTKSTFTIPNNSTIEENTNVNDQQTNLKKMSSREQPLPTSFILYTGSKEHHRDAKIWTMKLCSCLNENDCICETFTYEMTSPVPRNSPYTRLLFSNK